MRLYSAYNQITGTAVNEHLEISKKIVWFTNFHGLIITGGYNNRANSYWEVSLNWSITIGLKNVKINFSIKILSPSFERDPLQYELVCLFKRRKVMARALRVSVMCTPPVFDLSVSRDSVVLVSTCGQIDNYEIIFIL